MKAPTHYDSLEADLIADALWKLALSQGMIQYGQLAPIVKMEPSNPLFWQLLGEISADTQERFGVMLSAIVVNKRDGFPGGEFFDLAIDLNRGVNDQLEFWAREVQAVHAKAMELKNVNGVVVWR